MDTRQHKITKTRDKITAPQTHTCPQNLQKPNQARRPSPSRTLPHASISSAVSNIAASAITAPNTMRTHCATHDHARILGNPIFGEFRTSILTGIFYGVPAAWRRLFRARAPCGPSLGQRGGAPRGALVACAQIRRRPMLPCLLGERWLWRGRWAQCSRESTSLSYRR